MVSLQVEGIQIDFPYTPYACQQTYMASVITALQARQNALLESPTGTGKTMALLCSSLAWQSSVNSKIATCSSTSGKIKVEYTSEDVAPPVSSLAPKQQQNGGGGPVFIIYASRTHAQLQQVAQELKRSQYKPRTAVLGSRDQLCINEKLKARQLKGAVLDQVCSSMCAQRKCYYKLNFENAKKDQQQQQQSGGSTGGVMDIEDALAFGRSTSTCPYFNSRESANAAELVLMPYNYLLDTTIRATLKLDWSRAVVIFDEAHNLEDVASSAASFSISTFDLSACSKELLNLVPMLAGTSNLASSSSAGSGTTANMTTTAIAVATSGLGSNGKNAMPALADIQYLIKVVEQLEMRIHSLPVQLDKRTNALSCDLDGIYLVDLFIAAGIACEKAREVSAAIKKCADVLIEANSQAAQSSHMNGRAAPQPKLLLLSKCVDQLFKTYKKTTYTDLRRISTDYRLYLREERDDRSHRSSFSNLSPNSNGINSTKRVVNYWAFCGGVAMEELRDLGIRSVVMTSGTLSPMDSFKEDMRIPCHITLENPHVISDNQLWVGAVACGVNKSKLSSVYTMRDSDEYEDDVGKTILSICRSMHAKDPVVPGGTLVFFPSYAIMESLLAHWKNSSVFEQLRSTCGAVVVETRKKTKFEQKINNPAGSRFGGANKPQKKRAAGEDDPAVAGYDSEEEERAIVDNVIDEFNTALSRHAKCLLLAVCRGKVSEGIDFKDSRARTVVVVGIPFAPVQDPWVELKKKYLDMKLQQRSSQGSEAIGGVGVMRAPPRIPYGVQSQPQPPLQLNQPFGGTGNTSSQSASSSSSHVPSQINSAMTSFQPASSMLTSVGTHVLSGPSELTTAGTSLAPSYCARLSGRDWYNQTAVRAVNQAIGRIIRHEKDWGAVFLLDERYLQEGNVSLLSKWVRSRIKKYTACTAALNDSRAFLTACVDNKDLQVASKVPRSLGTIGARRNASHEMLYKRKVELSAEDVSAEDGGSFVDPRLLMSQQTYCSSQSGNNENVAQQQQQRSQQSLKQTAPQLGQRSVAGSSLAGIYNKAPTARAVLVQSANDSAALLRQQQHQQQLSEKISADAAARRNKERGSILSYTQQSVPPSLSQPPLSQPPLSQQPSMSFSQQPNTQTKVKSTTATQSSAVAAGSAVKGSSMAPPSQPYQPSKRAKLMLDASKSVPPSNTATTSKQPSAAQKTAAFLASLNTAWDQHVNNSTTSKSTATKAFAAVTSAGSVSNNSIKNSSSSAISRHEHVALQSSANISAASAKFNCIVCSEQNMAVKGAARGCGHVCCLDCWTKWLRIHSTCPYCRAPTVNADIKILSLIKKQTQPLQQK